MKKVCMKHILAVFILCLLFTPQIILAATTPLLMKGKQTLYQRVLAKPGSLLYSKSEQSSATKKALAFSIHYVYERKKISGTNWIQLGSDSSGNIKGWGLESDFLPWNHGLTVSFHDPAAHDRVLLFRNKHSLQDLISQDSTNLYASYYQDAVTATINKQSPVVSVQPNHNIDISTNFYLMPILRHEDTFMGAEKATMLEVAFVPGIIATSRQESQKPAVPKSANTQTTSTVDTSTPREFRAGIAFVVDSTTSMGPYIGRTRLAVRKVYESLNYADIEGSIDFAAVAYRDNMQAVEGLEYLTHTYANFEPGRSAKDYYTAIEKIIPSPVSTRDFIEDSYAGVLEAINSLNWDGISARYIVLITDAGARKKDDPLSGTRLNAAKLQQLARAKNINIIMLHLLTPEGENNHAEAQNQYKKLSTYPGIGDFYYGVATGDIEAYGRAIDTLAEQITTQVSQTSFSTRQTKTTEEPAPPETTTIKAETTEKASRLASFEQKLQKLGNAIKMQYLQDADSGSVPSLVKSWVVDRDFNDPSVPTMDVRVLLTRDQLSDLYDVMEQVLTTFQDGLLSPENFLKQIKTLAAKMSRDPAAIKSSKQSSEQSIGEQLDDMGFMREYIDDLPYQSEIMKVSLQDWESWPAKQQLELVNRLEEKIAWYKSLHNNAGFWYTPGGGAVNGNSVYPINIKMLP